MKAVNTWKNGTLEMNLNLNMDTELEHENRVSKFQGQGLVKCKAWEKFLKNEVIEICKK